MNTPANEIAVVTDSTADIPLEHSKALGITVVPVLVISEGVSYQDGVELSREEFGRMLIEMDDQPTSAAPSPDAFSSAYEQAFSSGAKEILSLHVSGSLSGVVNAATIGAKPFGDRVHIYDSQQVSLGLGFQAMEAAEQAKSGAGMDTLLALLEKTKERLRMLVMIDSLENLKRSGRVSWLSASLREILNIKLLVRIIEGEVERVGQVRTARSALQSLEEAARSWSPLKRYAVGHSAALEKGLAFAQSVQVESDEAAFVFATTPAISIHVGPGALGVFGQLR
jgi:DegV family protein with EDD domain